MIECPLCRKTHKNWQAYAEHLLEEHPEDEDRCEWARAMIALAENETEVVELGRVRGKPAGKIPPTRERPDKIPEYLKKQLGG